MQYAMPTGLFNEDETFVFDSQIFFDEKPSFYGFVNETRTMTGAEVFANFPNKPERLKQ